MSYFETILFYNLILILSWYLAQKSSNNRYGMLAVFVVFLVSACRYDIGNDYETQYKIWNYVAQLWKEGYPLSVILIQTQEIVTIILTYLLQGIAKPAVYIFAIHVLVFFYFLYKALRENDCIASGLFALLTLLYLFYSWDWTRQAVAYAIGLYSLRYVRTGEFWNFVKYVLFAFCFHSSAVVLILLYPLRYVDIKRTYSVLLVVLFTLLGYTGILDGAATYIIDNIDLPFYNNYKGAAHSMQFVKMSSGFTVLMKSFISIIILMYIPNNQKVLRNCVTLGTILYIIASQNLLIERISYYFMIFQIVAFKYLFVNTNDIAKKTVRIIVVSILILFYNYAIINVGGTRGAVPYDSVFSENCEKEIFRYRGFL